jgi:hypothetical protein
MAEDVSAYTSAAWVTKIVKRESGCRKLRYCGLRDIERPRYIGLRLATAKALEGFLPLMGRESSGTTKTHAPGAMAVSANLASSVHEPLDLALGEIAALDCEVFSVWCAGIGCLFCHEKSPSG